MKKTDSLKQCLHRYGACMQYYINDGTTHLTP